MKKIDEGQFRKALTAAVESDPAKLDFFRAFAEKAPPAALVRKKPDRRRKWYNLGSAAAVACVCLIITSLAIPDLDPVRLLEGIRSGGGMAKFSQSADESASVEAAADADVPAGSTESDAATEEAGSTESVVATEEAGSTGSVVATEGDGSTGSAAPAKPAESTGSADPIKPAGSAKFADPSDVAGPTETETTKPAAPTDSVPPSDLSVRQNVAPRTTGDAVTDPQAPPALDARESEQSTVESGEASLTTPAGEAEPFSGTSDERNLARAILSVAAAMLLGLLLLISRKNITGRMHVVYASAGIRVFCILLSGLLLGLGIWSLLQYLSFGIYS